MKALLPTILLFILPTILAQVNIFPNGEFVSTPGGTATFTCLSLTGTSLSEVRWLINGTEFSDTGSMNSNIEVGFNSLGGVGILRLTDIPVSFNKTRFRCTARISGKVSISVDAVLLLLQGRLTAVESLELTVHDDSSITLSWMPPFTLDIEDIHPDIDGYCVDIVDSVSMMTLYSECGLNRTEFSYPIPPENGCRLYINTITPVNTVGNGTRSAVFYRGTTGGPQVAELNVSRNGDLREFTLIMSGPVCDGELTLVDLDTGERVLKQGSDLTIAGNTISFTSSGLTPSRRYSVTTVASNIGGSATSYTIISTHDLVDAMAAEAIGGGIELSASYAEDSSASGVLFCFVFVTEDGGIDISRTAFLVVDRTTHPGHTLPFDLHSGRYKTYSYDIGSRGVLSTGVAFPAVTSGLTVRSRDDDGEIFKATYSLLESCEVDSAIYSIRVECSQPSNSLATGLQVIVQLTNASEVQKLYVNQSMDPHTPVTVEVERDGLYLVTIFPLREGRGILDSIVEYSEQLEVIATLPNEGLKTEPTDDNSPPSDSFNVQLTAIVAAAVVIIVLIVMVSLVIVVVFVVQRKKSHTKQVDQHHPPSNDYVEIQSVSKSTSPRNRSSPTSSETHREEVTIVRNKNSPALMETRLIPDNDIGRSSASAYDDPAPQDHASRDPTPQEPMPQDPAPQDPVPQDPVPQDSAPRDPAPTSQDPMPQDPVPQDHVPQDPAPQDPVPQDSAPVPQDPAPQDTAPQHHAPQTASGEVTNNDFLHIPKIRHSVHRTMKIDLISHEQPGSHNSTPMLARSFSEGVHLQPGWMPPNLVAATRSVNDQDVAAEFASGITTFPTRASASTTMPGDDHRDFDPPVHTATEAGPVFQVPYEETNPSDSNQPSPAAAQDIGFDVSP